MYKLETVKEWKIKLITVYRNHTYLDGGSALDHARGFDLDSDHPSYPVSAGKDSIE